LTAVPSGKTLTAVLRHHAIPENNILFADITNALESPATLQGDMLTFQRLGNLVGVTNGTGNSSSEIIIELVNTQANNVLYLVLPKYYCPIPK